MYPGSQTLSRLEMSILDPVVNLLRDPHQLRDKIRRRSSFRDTSRFVICCTVIGFHRNCSDVCKSGGGLSRQKKSLLAEIIYIEAEEIKVS